MTVVLVSDLGCPPSPCSADVVAVVGGGHAVAACPSVSVVSPQVQTSDVVSEMCCRLDSEHIQSTLIYHQLEG